MKRISRIIIVMILMSLLAGCGSKVERDITSTGLDEDNNQITNAHNGSDKAGLDSTLKDGNNSDDGSINNEIYTFMAQVIENGSTILVAPAQDSNELKSSDRIAVTVADDAIKGQNGNSIDRQELKPGDLVRISYNGGIRESYPAQISASLIELTGRNILIDAYIALIDDIYKEDPGLNGNISMMALNTLGWSDLTDIDKEIIFSLLKASYGLEILEATYDELVKQGLIDEEMLYFEKGILIIIKNFNYDEEKQAISCSIEKWRSGKGAIGSNNVTAEYKDGKWEISKTNIYMA